MTSLYTSDARTFKRVVKRIMCEKDDHALSCGVRDAFSYEFVTYSLVGFVTHCDVGFATDTRMGFVTHCDVGFVTAVRD